jgi:hypothetical protein
VAVEGTKGAFSLVTWPNASQDFNIAVHKHLLAILAKLSYIALQIICNNAASVCLL